MSTHPPGNHDVGLFHALCSAYLVGDLDEDDENKQVVKDTNSADDDVDDLESKVMTSGARSRMLARYRFSASSSDVTVFQISLDSDAFSIAATICLSLLPQQPIEIPCSRSYA